MKQMSFVCLYLDYLENFRLLSDAAVGKLVRAMLQYAITGEDTQLTGKAGVLWPTLRSQMDRDAEKYRERCETNRINAAKGGRPRKNQSVILETEGFFEKPKKPNEKENEKENINENININENKNDKDKENVKEKDRTKEKEKEKEKDPWEDSWERKQRAIRMLQGYTGGTDAAPLCRT